ncbi:hypothetical protein RF11_11131 [Thelohanellus kitauei]|uniref:Uncharacterized protein n=1 Tax=Thelohanellus kitauei TaxID=669202 RepID=A0A0C2MMC6_THEKT|nr:hypothetical protein RF11_11131 [Thelohanellus kitauei]
MILVFNILSMVGEYHYATYHIDPDTGRRSCTDESKPCLTLDSALAKLVSNIIIDFHIHLMIFMITIILNMCILPSSVLWFFFVASLNLFVRFSIHVFNYTQVSL